MPTPSPARIHDFEVVSNDKIADDIYSIVISAPKLATMLEPGQFVNIAVPGVSANLLRVPLSYAKADPEAGTVEIWYAVVGEGTRNLSLMEPGSTSNLLGPGGHGWVRAVRCSLPAASAFRPFWAPRPSFPRWAWLLTFALVRLALPRSWASTSFVRLVLSL